MCRPVNRRRHYTHSGLLVNAINRWNSVVWGRLAKDRQISTAFGVGNTGSKGYETPFQRRRDAGVVERGGLENRCTFTSTEGSNPSLSASFPL